MGVWWVSRDSKSKAAVYAHRSAEIIGDKEFVKETKAKLVAKAIGRREMKNIEGYELKERQSPYSRVFDPEKCGLRLKNDHLWQDS